MGFALCVLTACLTVGPDYTPPLAATPGAWHSALPDGIVSGPMDVDGLAQWWAAFNDPILSELISQSIADNLDVHSAMSRVRQARAQRNIARAGLLPTLDSSASVTTSETRQRDKNFGVTETQTDLYRGGFDASWEVDVFGGLRRSVEASGRDLQAAQAELYDVLVSLTAEVALNYVDARAYQKRLDLALDNLQIQKETLDLVQSRFEVDLVDELPVQQARYSYESTAAQIPTLRTGLEQSLNRLAVLLGEAPGAVHERMESHEPIPQIASTVAVGVPSELLRSRPDIRQAEETLAAQTARIGVAVADLYPKFYLTGSWSRQGVGSLGFREYPTDTWSLGPSVSWNLFKGGAIRQNVKVQEEIKQQDLLAYQSTVLSALEEVENNLFALGQERLRQESLAKAAEAAHSAMVVSQEQYKVGWIDFTDVLSAQQAVVSYQDQFAQSEGTIATDMISLFKALGGGWSPTQMNEGLPQGGPRKGLQVND